jgi:hypothetical protein
VYCADCRAAPFGSVIKHLYCGVFHYILVLYGSAVCCPLRQRDLYCNTALFVVSVLCLAHLDPFYPTTLNGYTT